MCKLYERETGSVSFNFRMTSFVEPMQATDVEDEQEELTNLDNPIPSI